MTYIVFARKWRPKTFDEVIGQEHITTTLKNAIEQKRVAHAYLFCGPRGTGKTTTARLLAKALNCEKGPTPDPCNKCTSCLEITEGRSIDIIEIDAASNRGIDEIRSLRESVKFRPQGGRYKVYIIDEVHMLTQEAFNALLKTLEEPPAYIKFVFATTAAHKVLPTILSRCQKFDFKRISSKDIISKVKKITAAEKIKIEEAALFTIVRAASGSMRDAESILDQMNSFTKGRISLDSVNSVLGLISQNILMEFTQSIIKKDTASALKLVDKIMNDGKDGYQFLANLIEYFRNILIAKQGKDLGKLLNLLPEEIESISKQAANFTIEDILYILYTLINTTSSMRYAPSVRIPLEMLAVKLTRRESIVSLAEILKRIAALEERIVGDIQLDSLKKAVKTPEQIAKTPQETKTAGKSEHLDSASLYRLREIWPQAIKRIKIEKIYVASCLEGAEIVEFKDNILTLGYAKNNKFHKEILEKTQNKKLIEAIVSELLNAKVVIEYIMSDKIKSAGEEKSDSDKERKNRPEARRDSIKKALSDPIIQSALDIFDGNIMKFF
ncbi:MAG: DNA polymerase III subunit gamma/tau [Candidatus Omnitrophota bacterium]|nr:MAG: DNA polymerase III subunit gamma/tau [Candidatus Omnitrophota bacterium]